jgi:hypothetical protein
MYPKKLYAPTGGHVVAEDAAHERALGPGWSENPPPAPAEEEDDAKEDDDATKPAPAKRKR